MVAEPAQLLAAWEAGLRVPPVARPAVLLHRAGLAEDLDAALDLPVGEGAALAARLHVEAFGAAVDGVLRCGGCGEELDVHVRLTDVAAEEGEAHTEVAGLVVRAPTTRDLVAGAGTSAAPEALLARCVRDAEGRPVEADELDAERLAAVDAAAEELAGAAGLVLRSECPTCGEDVSAPLDLGALLWEQVARSARVLLAEIADLAMAFGWAEADVLALTPLRRRAYLRLARGEG